MKSPKIELIYDADCPNITAARNQLETAAKDSGVELMCQEWDRGDQNAPDYVRTYGSPTILVNGQDVVASDNPDAGCCRIYVDETGAMRGVPATAKIVDSLKSAIAEPK